MKIAVPVENGRLTGHFGGCAEMAFLTVADGQVTDQQTLATPAHEPGVFPRWLAEQGANVVIAGGMGQRALNMLAQANIEVILGAPAETPDALAAAYLAGTLTAGANACTHDHDHGHGHGHGHGHHHDHGHKCDH